MGLLMPAVLFDVRFALIQATNVGNNHKDYTCCMQDQIISNSNHRRKKRRKTKPKKNDTIASSTGFFSDLSHGSDIIQVL